MERKGGFFFFVCVCAILRGRKSRFKDTTIPPNVCWSLKELSTKEASLARTLTINHKVSRPYSHTATRRLVLL